MKKTLFTITAIFLASLMFIACGDNGNTKGGGSYIGKAFTFASVESEDDKPEEPSNDTSNDTSDNDGNFGEITPSQPAKDYTETVKKEWIYFQDETKVVYGNVSMKITYDGETDEEKNREIENGSYNRLYYGDYLEIPTADEEIAALNLNYSYSGTLWSKIEKPYEVKRGFELKTAPVATKRYEFGLNKSGDLIIKLTENKGAYNEWTTWTWEEFNVVEEMKVNEEFISEEIMNKKFSTEDGKFSYEFINGAYKKDGEQIDKTWSLVKKGNSINLYLVDKDNTLQTKSFFTKKFGELPRVESERNSATNGFSDMEAYYDVELNYFSANLSYYIQEYEEGTDQKKLLDELKTRNISLSNLTLGTVTGFGGYGEGFENITY